MRRSKKSMNLSEVMESVSYLKNLGVKYNGILTGKTNTQSILNEIIGDYVGFDKRFNNGKGVKRAKKKFPKLIDRVINYFIP